ncbi:MAG: hypothetical protein GDA36_04590 [Rhodobacteraceae bacterium]|nr:hypothetical protein [Paracoccaceae bacterium]
MRRPIAVFATCDDLAPGVCRQIGDHGLKLKKIEASIIDATLVQSAACSGSHSNADTQARWVRYAGRQDGIQRRCPPGRGPDEESFINKVHMGHLRTGRAPGV